MSVQAGIWHFDGKPANQDILQRISGATAHHAPDGEDLKVMGPIGMLYRRYHTTHDSPLKRQPYKSSAGLIYTWDGRLDNRDELMAELSIAPGSEVTDVDIVSAAFERWHSDAFRKLDGDWALVIWDAAKQNLILAKDYMGIRHLYFQLAKDRMVWCTHLAPILLLSGTSYTVNDDYIAGYLASFPSAHETPYREIQAVPPGSVLLVKDGKINEKRYWSFEPQRRIRYKTDAEYEEHFRYVFREAVRRRLRSDWPILAELSGGLDSSSIVCMADQIVACGEASSPRLDTLSLYSSHEPGGDERSFSAIVEKQRGRQGHHFDREQYCSTLSFDTTDFDPTPGRFGNGGKLIRSLIDMAQTQGYRVVLSGYGGDELLGGVPNPCPQLADLIALPRPIQLARQLIAWSLIKKRPWIQLLWETLCYMLPLGVRVPASHRPTSAPWIDRNFARRHRLVTRQFGPQGTYGFFEPSRREYARTVIAIRRQIAYFAPHALECEEKRYPYLDRRLVEFLLAIPASQLLRPGQRRSLMRRALADIVPAEILWRKTKGNLSRGPLVELQNAWPTLENLCASTLAARMGYVDQSQFRKSLEAAKHGDASQLIPLLKTLSLELWLQSVAKRGLVNFDSNVNESVNARVSAVRALRAP